VDPIVSRDPNDAVQTSGRHACDYGGLPCMQQSGAELLPLAGFTSAKQHDAWEQPPPLAIGTASARHDRLRDSEANQRCPRRDTVVKDARQPRDVERCQLIHTSSLHDRCAAEPRLTPDLWTRGPVVDASPATRVTKHPLGARFAT